MMFASAAFSPLSLSPALWLDASDASTLYSGASLASPDGAISEWRDKSGNAFNATQSTGVSQPLRKTAIQNGRDIVRFDGSNDYLISASNSLLRDVGGATIFCVRKWNSSPTTSPIIFSVRSSSALSIRAGIFGGIVANKASVGGRRLDSDSFASIPSSANVSTSLFESQSGVFDYANSDLSQYINGSLDGSTTTFQTNGNTSDTDSSGITVGATAVGTQVAHSDIAEILVFPRVLATAERQAVELYLANKWAIY